MFPRLLAVRRRLVTYVSIGSCLVGALATSGCGELDDQEPIEVVRGEIRDGAPVVTDNIGTPSLQQVVAPAFCSGTMLSRRWVLTARHCVTTNAIWNGPKIPDNGETVKLIGGVSSQSVQIMTHPDLDVALVRLANDLTRANGTTFLVGNRLYPGTTAGLVGGPSLYTQGWGAQGDCSNPIPAGQLTSANLQIAFDTGADAMFGLPCQATAGTAACFTVIKNANYQIEQGGDSGSSLLFTMLGRSRPVGVFHDNTCDVANHMKVNLFRDWVNAVVGNGPATGSPAGFERAASPTSNGINQITYVQTNHPKRLVLTPGMNWALGDYTTSPTNAPQSSDDRLSQYIRSDSTSAVVYKDSANKITELRVVPPSGTWNKATLTSNANVFGPPTGYARTDNVNAVVFQATDFSIHELSLTPGASQWGEAPLNASAPHGASTMLGSPVGYIRADGINAVVYGNGSAHVAELKLQGGTWVYTDLFTDASCPSCLTAKTGLRVRPYTRADGVTSVLYVDNSNNLHELALVPGAAHWAHFAFPNAKPVDSEPAPFVRNDGITSVLYVSAAPESHVHEIQGDPIAGWSDHDITTEGGGFQATGGGGVLGGYVRSDGFNAVVYRRLSDQHIHELTNGGAGWFDGDPTAQAGGGP